MKIHAVRQPAQKGLGRRGEPGAAARRRRAVPLPAGRHDLQRRRQRGPARQLVDALREFGTSHHRPGGSAAEKVEPVRRSSAGPSSREACCGSTRWWKSRRRSRRPSRLAIAARYVLTPAIFDCLDATPPGKGGEVQLTDALRLLLAREPVHGVRAARDAARHRQPDRLVEDQPRLRRAATRRLGPHCGRWSSRSSARTAARLTEQAGRGRTFSATSRIDGQQSRIILESRN